MIHRPEKDPINCGNGSKYNCFCHWFRNARALFACLYFINVITDVLVRWMKAIVTFCEISDPVERKALLEMFRMPTIPTKHHCCHHWKPQSASISVMARWLSLHYLGTLSWIKGYFFKCVESEFNELKAWKALNTDAQQHVSYQNTSPTTNCPRSVICWTSCQAVVTPATSLLAW